MLFPMRKLTFGDSGSVRFFSWLKTGGSVRKNSKLTDQVCFIYHGFFILMESAKKKKHAEDHRLNSKSLPIQTEHDKLLLHEG